MRSTDPWWSYIYSWWNNKKAMRILFEPIKQWNSEPVYGSQMLLLIAILIWLLHDLQIWCDKPSWYGCCMIYRYDVTNHPDMVSAWFTDMMWQTILIWLLHDLQIWCDKPSWYGFCMIYRYDVTNHPDMVSAWFTDMMWQTILIWFLLDLQM